MRVDSDIELEIDENRYSRLKLIPWWDQDRLFASRVMVVGAGALGNEVIKNLALLGVGNLLIVDFDRVESSNLSRSVLFRPQDEGKPKAECAARAARQINPDVKAVAIVGDVIHDVGLGTFRAVDLVIAGLDSREARLAVNVACWKVGKPWIDGAIEALHGVARVFVPPDSACYECTMNEMDRRLVAARQSCSLLTRDDFIEGKIPTTPTTASVIAGIQTQEAVKLLHARRDLPSLAGRGFFFNGLTHDSFVVEYDRNQDCSSHETFEAVEELQLTSDATLKELVEIATSRLGEGAVIDFGREVVTSLQCSLCGTNEKVFRALGKLASRDARCGGCGGLRTPELTHSISAHDEHLGVSLREVGFPPYDIITARRGFEMLHLEIAGDRFEVMGA